MGVAVGDYDGDGLPDLYVTQYGRSILYHNNGNGTFSDVTEKAGVSAPGWASSAVWFDYDNDGRLDLFVCALVEFEKSKNQFCGDSTNGQRYLLHSEGVSTRAKLVVSQQWGRKRFAMSRKKLGSEKRWARRGEWLRLILTHDGWMDLFVANDTMPNFLFLNRNGKFGDVALEASVAYSQDGRARSGMGVDSADFDQDGWQDLFVSNVDQEMYSLYRNEHDLTFTDIAGNAGYRKGDSPHERLGC
jgi:hypothetical protein